ncbi:hypothetical protein F5J12DRAFT_782073 [Pisolithus orientalis]|uniref:uncharacterized protein n=1 Tax=Pisolithus orientalis TaxID=936130 RepID=UPI00222572F6|nr:uncharacterized protein F5J12DRAFT_782073 [Pisolithus orientalis]KAI6009568.1 hypothetical protein F5J12DRAFT_782073 [Pisolithus orientalis]
MGPGRCMRGKIEKNGAETCASIPRMNNAVAAGLPLLDLGDMIYRIFWVHAQQIQIDAATYLAFQSPAMVIGSSGSNTQHQRPQHLLIISAFGNTNGCSQHCNEKDGERGTVFGEEIRGDRFPPGMNKVRHEAKFDFLYVRKLQGKRARGGAMGRESEADRWEDVEECRGVTEKDKDVEDTNADVGGEPESGFEPVTPVSGVKELGVGYHSIQP